MCMSILHPPFLTFIGLILISRCPPKVKNRPANMKQFTELQCRIRRENDADYEFKLKIIGQLVRDLNAVILEHTSNIRRLHIRNSERLHLDLEMEFEIVAARQFEKIKDVTATHHHHHQQQYPSCFITFSFCHRCLI